MSGKKPVKKVEEKVVEPIVEEVKETPKAKIYPDVEYNKKERRKAIILAALLVLLMGGMALVTAFGGQEFNMVSMMMGAIMLVVVVIAVSTIPSSFKQYPVKDEPIIEVSAKEATIMRRTVKISDIQEIRLTITLPNMGTKAENEKLIDECCNKEPERGVTANLDFIMKTVDPTNKKKDNNIYTTVANGYEALLTFYKAGVKHYQIVYSLKKLAKLSNYNLGETVTEDGVKLANVSKKDRLKQLY